MEFLKTLFKHTAAVNNSKYRGTSKNIMPNEDPIKSIEECTNVLEDINYSPMPSSKEDLRQQHYEISVCLRKIVFNFDLILNDNLKPTRDRKNSISNIGDITQSEDHYWNYISKFFRTLSVKFMNDVYDKVQSTSEKGLLWIYISIMENSLFDTLKDIYSLQFDK